MVLCRIRSVLQLASLLLVDMLLLLLVRGGGVGCYVELVSGCGDMGWRCVCVCGVGRH